MSWDPYAALGVSRSASADEIKKAYRKLAKELHPDVRPDDPASEERFKRATAAFNLLSEPKQKARYDRGEIDADGQEQNVFQSGGFGGYGPGSGQAPPHGDAFEDLFDGLFGGGRRRAGPVRGRDVRYSVEIDFLDAVNGSRRRLTMPDGKSLDVAIPAGVKSGQTLRLRSQGEAGRSGAAPGDALLEITVTDHPVYRRDGLDIHMDVPVTLAEAVLGDKIEINSPQGRVTLTVPGGSNTGSTLRLKNKGVQAKSGAGHLYAHLQVQLPDKPDDELKSFLKGWSRKDQKPANR